MMTPILIKIHLTNYCICLVSGRGFLSDVVFAMLSLYFCIAIDNSGLIVNKQQKQYQNKENLISSVINTV